MPDVVIDGSVAAKWVLAESNSHQAHQVMQDVLVAGDHLIVLDLTLTEVTNSIWKRFYRGLMTDLEARQGLADLRRCPVRVEAAGQFLEPALDLAMKYRITVYDALFVALANDLGLRGVTADTKLHAAVHADFPGIILLSDW